MLLVHGLNDWNVKTGQVWNSRHQLKSRPITQKLILHQGQHEYLNNFRSFDYTDLVNLWLSNKLLGVQNQVDAIFPDVIVQDNAKAETWTPFKDWGGSETVSKSYSLAQLINLSDHNHFSDQLPEVDFNRYTQKLEQWRSDLYQRNGSPMDRHCIRLVTKPLDDDLVIDGQPSVKLKVQSSADVGMIKCGSGRLWTRSSTHGRPPNIGFKKNSPRISLAKR